MMRQPGDLRQGQVINRVTLASEALRARNLEKHLRWAQLLQEPVVRRLADSPIAAMRAQVLVQTALTCSDIAAATWATSDDQEMDPASLVKACFATFTMSAQATSR